MYGRIRRIHFVGIGGTGMCGIAEVLLNQGFEVSGSDLAATPVTERLASLGGRIRIGHQASNVEGADVVVVSSAVKAENPEVVAARERKIPVIPRAEMLAELMRVKYAVAVAGAHGKTTTTSMVASVLAAGGLDPTVVVGGRVRALGSNAVLGKGDFLVAEADESDGSFLKLTPSIAVVTSLDEEHLDHYGTMETLVDAFVAFANKVPFYGVDVVCVDDPRIRAILPRLERRVITYGTSEDADLSARQVTHEGLGQRFRVVSGGLRLGEVALRMPGSHNVWNALAAVAVGLELEIPFAAIREGLARFEGVSRRFEVKGEGRGVTVLDDYGHHPTEMTQVFRTAKHVFPGRLFAIFQPHRFSRTAALWREFGACLTLPDRVFVLPIYAAGEKPVEGISSESIVRAAREAGQKEIEVADARALPSALPELVRPGDVILTIGAGDVWKLGEDIAARLAAGGGA